MAAVGWIPVLGGKFLLLEILHTSVEEGKLERSWELPPLCLTSIELEGTGEAVKRKVTILSLYVPSGIIVAWLLEVLFYWIQGHKTELTFGHRPS